ncbi:hypothetical protein BKA60DRAFT_585353 [Fusarium oxysporum]|nr:hypothetical protein BKA60DRAFT_585353 [Fusarium oxysporum]
MSVWSAIQAEQQRQLYSELLGKACALERELLKFQLPFVGLIDDTRDPCTTPDHFLAVSRCYRLAVLLELYQAFPEIIQKRAIPEQAINVKSKEHGDQRYFLADLAFTVFGILEAIPSDSGTVSTRLLALIIAGSALSPATPSLSREAIPGRVPLHQEVISWRDCVQQHVHNMYAAVTL